MGGRHCPNVLGCDGKDDPQGAKKGQCELKPSMEQKRHFCFQLALKITSIGIGENRRQ
jgi:hypothetical protein